MNTTGEDGAQGELAAGAFSAWLGDMQSAIRGDRGSDVPCNGCTACCTSSKFVHIEPDETDTLVHIPRQLLFPAPRRPAGHVILGYDERGHCPMLVDNRCSIYEHRPRTCRTYDCRVFAATGVEPDDDHGLIADRARRWRFEFPTDVDRVEHDAVRAAAKFVAERDGAIDDESRTTNSTQLAVLAIEVYDAFLRRDPDTGDVEAVEPDIAEVRVALGRRRPRLTGNP